MSISSSFKAIGALVAATLVLALPVAAASANIAFTRGTVRTFVYTANDGGKSVKKVGEGRNAFVSPDGASLVYYHEGPAHTGEMKLTTVGGGAGKTLMRSWQEPFALVWSPNSEFVLAERGGELGKRKLVLVTVATGAQRVLADGYIHGFSFDPEGKEVVFAKSNTEKYPPKSDVFIVSAAGGKVTALTSDHRSEAPIWGPTGKIAFVKQLGANSRKYGPKTEIYLMNATGKGVKRLTHTKVDPLLIGLFPTAWSANGKRLLAQFGGQDTSYAVGVNALTGAQKPIVEATEEGFVGTALSSDGKTVFGYEGGFDPGNAHRVVSVPWSGGKARILVNNASEPSFSF
jgi:hypothetical protein